MLQARNGIRCAHERRRGGWIFITSGPKHVSTIPRKMRPEETTSPTSGDEQIHEIAVYIHKVQCGFHKSL